jgi:hypothetical protein
MQTAQQGLRHQTVPNPVWGDNQQLHKNGLVGVDLFALFQFIAGTAIRTHGFTRTGHIKKDTRVVAPDRHIGVGAMHGQVLCPYFHHRQLCGLTHDDSLNFA